jgi:hypothetical protein
MKDKLPCKRSRGLIVHALPDETLVYDLSGDQAMCLNATAALVFAMCDGRTTPEAMAKSLARRLDVADAAPLVTAALDELAKAKLLEGKAARKGAKIPRRALLKKAGIAAALAPAVFAILAPTAASAASYILPGVAPLTPGCAQVASPAPRCPNQKCTPLRFPQRYCRTALTGSGPQRRTCTCR